MLEKEEVTRRQTGSESQAPRKRKQPDATALFAAFRPQGRSLHWRGGSGAQSVHARGGGGPAPPRREKRGTGRLPHCHAPGGTRPCDEEPAPDRPSRSRKNRSVATVRVDGQRSGLGFSSPRSGGNHTLHRGHPLSALGRTPPPFLQGERGQRLRRMLGSAHARWSFPEGGDVMPGLDPEFAAPGGAERGLADLFAAVGRLARRKGTGVLLTVDEVQYLRQAELGALIAAAHRAHQEDLPVVLAGAGLPSARAQAGKARTYAERMFDFRVINSLPREDSREALEDPAKRRGVPWEPEALDTIGEATRGYPYFLQEFASRAWDLGQGDAISADDARRRTRLRVRQRQRRGAPSCCSSAPSSSLWAAGTLPSTIPDTSSITSSKRRRRTIASTRGPSSTSARRGAGTGRFRASLGISSSTPPPYTRPNSSAESSVQAFRTPETRQPGGRPDRGPSIERRGSSIPRGRRPAVIQDKRKQAQPEKKRKYAPESLGPNRKKEEVTRQRRLGTGCRKKRK